MRYTGPRGKAFSGDKAKAQSLQRAADLLVGQVVQRLKAPPFNGKGHLVQRKRLMDGSWLHVMVNMIGMSPIIRTWIECPTITTSVLPENALSFPGVAVVWLPEGIVITPRSADAPYGYGMPRRDATTGERINPPFGTLIEAEEDEAVNQALFNRFKNNKYLDSPQYIESARLAGEFPKGIQQEDGVSAGGSLPIYNYWQPFFTPGLDFSFWENDDALTSPMEEPGLSSWEENSIKPAAYSERNQFFADGSNNLYEAESIQWFCHWPEEVLFANEAFEAVFQRTNYYREAAGRSRVTRPLRGIYSSALITSLEVARAKSLTHDSTNFRPGYTTYELRNNKTGTVEESYAENLYCGGSTELSWSRGEEVVDSWSTSPGHFANIIHAEWDTPKSATSLDVFGGIAATVNEDEAGSLDPPVSGAVYVQEFSKRARWLYTSEIPHRCQLGTVSSGCFRSPVGRLTDYNHDSVYYAGREYRVKNIADRISGGEYTQLLGGSVFLGDDGRRWLRVVVAYTDATATIGEITSYIAPLGLAEGEIWQVEASLGAGALDSVEDIVTAALFNPAGTECFITARRNTHDRPTMLFPPRPSDPVLTRHDHVVFQLKNGAFSVFAAVSPPNISHEVEIDTVGSTTRLTRYVEAGAGAFPIVYFYDQQGNVAFVSYEMDLRIDQTNDYAGNVSAYFRSRDALVFPSGKRVQISNQVITDGVLSNDYSFSAILFLDPYTEDVATAEIHCTSDTSYIYGAMDIVVNGEVAASYDERILATNPGVPTISATWETMSISTAATGVYMSRVVRSAESDYTRYPVPRVSSNISFFCPSYGDSVLLLEGKLISGDYPASLTLRAGGLATCYAKSYGSDVEFVHTYCPSIPIGSLLNDSTMESVTTRLAGYRDRVVVQADIGSLCGFYPSASESRTIYANFNINAEVGIGELTNILPMGVV